MSLIPLYISAVTCLPRSFSHIVSSEDVSVGSVVTVSCPNQQVFVNSLSGKKVMTSTCTETGNWRPDIPDCTGK